MSNPYWEKLEQVFQAVADLPEPEREVRLTELCGDDEMLRREIRALIAADEKVADFCEVPAVLPDSLFSPFAADGKQPVETLIGEKLGAYRVVRSLGTGGMGAVYLAVRADGEFDKKVAIKIVRSDSGSDLNLARFRNERQALAALEHPNIARLLDGGTTSGGLPYLVMEYVEGKQLFHHCDAGEMGLNERLDLFRQICSAVSHAHGKQIIHRDLKPGNILVDGTGMVKLLDFGIAKILDEELAHGPVARTATLMRQMTPEYASPEQVLGEPVTPASDVYSLGVILFELVTGERPYRFTSRAPHEIARVVCEDEIIIPEFKFKVPNADDLKFIILSSLRKIPSERFPSAASLGAAVERFQAGLPVMTGSLLEKGVVTHDRAAALVTLAVAPFQILSAGSRDIGNPDDEYLGVGLADALTTRLSTVRRLSVRPTSSVLRAAAGGGDIRGLGETLGADNVLGGHILRVGERVRISVQLLRTRDDSVLWAERFDETDEDLFRLQDAIAERVASSLIPHLTADDHEKLHRRGTSDPAAFEAYMRGRAAYCTYTFAGIAASEAHFRKAIEHDPEFALAHSGLADFHNWRSVAGLTAPADGFPAAKRSAERAIEIDPNLSEAYASLAFAIWAYDWDLAEAERLFLKAIEINRNNTKAHEWYAYLLSSDGRHDAALVEMRRAESLDPNSPSVAAMFGFLLYNARRYEEGLTKTRRALALEPDYYLALQGLGWVCPPLGMFDEAVAGCRRAVEISDELCFNKLSLGMALAAAGGSDEARRIAAEIESAKQKAEVPAYYLGLIYAALGDTDVALTWLERAIKERGYWTLWMKVEPRFDALRGDERFDKLVEQIRPLNSSPSTPDPEDVPAGGSRASVRSRFRLAIASGAVFIFAALAAAAFLGTADLHRSSQDAQQAVQPPASEVEPVRRDDRDNRDPVAQDLYRAGQRQLATRTTDGLTKATDFFTEATKRDPNYALAYAGLAEAQVLLAGREDTRSSASFRKAEEYAIKALAIDPDLAEARTSLGMAKFRTTHDLAQAEKHFLRAIELSPSLATAHYWYSIALSEAGRVDEAMRESSAAVEIDPTSPVFLTGLATHLIHAGRYDEAINYCDKAIERDNSFVRAYVWKSLVEQYQGKYDDALETYRKARIYNGKDENEPLWILMHAHAHAANGRHDEALSVLNRLLQGAEFRKSPAAYASDVALVYNLLGDTENAVAWLRKVKVDSDVQARRLAEDPRFANLRADERFAALTRRPQGRI